MSIQSRSSSPPADRWAVALAFAALGLFACSWLALHHGWLSRHPIIDTPVYEKYCELMVQGQVPYRDFDVEYPPGALPVFVQPARGNVGDFEGFRRSFETLMAACGGAVLIAIAFTRSARRGGDALVRSRWRQSLLCCSGRSSSPASISGRRRWRRRRSPRSPRVAFASGTPSSRPESSRSYGRPCSSP